MTALINELKLLYDNQYSILPLLNNSGVKIFTQWSCRTATFSFVSGSHVVVKLSSLYPSVDRQVLETAIIRIFKWEPIKYKTCCCGLLRRKVSDELHFSL